MTYNNTNLTCFRLLPETEFHNKVIYSLLTIIVGCLGIGLNSNVLRHIRAHITLQTYVNGLIVNLCIADILSIASLIVLTVTKIVRQHVLELIADRIFYIAYHVTVLMIATIAVDKFAFLKYSFYYSSRMTGTKVLEISACCWMYSLLVSLLPFAFERMPTMFENSCTTVTSRIGQFILKACLLYFPCLVVIFVCYCKIYRIKRYYSRAITAVDRSVVYNSPSHRIQQSTNHVTTLLQVLVPFLGLTLPEKLFVIYNSNKDIHFYFVIIASINCIFNPWIYAYNISEFKAALRSPTPIRNGEVLRRKKSTVDAMADICDKEGSNSRHSVLALEDEKSMEVQAKADSEGRTDSKLSLSGYVSRKCSYTEAATDTLSVIFGNEYSNSRPPVFTLENKKSMTEQNKTDSEGDRRLSWIRVCQQEMFIHF